MNRSFTAAQLAKRFERLALTADAKLAATAKAVGQNTQRHIQAMYGTDRLAPLQPATIADKERRGSEFPDAPLIDTGEMRASEESAVRKTPYGYEAGAGNPDPKALWHEIGVAQNNLPPRPVHFEGAMDASESNFALVLIGASSIGTNEPPLTRLVGHLATRTKPAAE